MSSLLYSQRVSTREAEAIKDANHAAAVDGDVARDGLEEAHRFLRFGGPARSRDETPFGSDLDGDVTAAVMRLAGGAIAIGQIAGVPAPGSSRTA